MKEQLNDKEHMDILNNKEAELFVRINAFQNYIELDFEADKALSLASLTEDDIHRNPLLRLYYIETKRKTDPNYNHKTYRV